MFERFVRDAQIGVFGQARIFIVDQRPKEWVGNNLIGERGCLARAPGYSKMGKSFKTPSFGAAHAVKTFGKSAVVFKIFCQSFNLAVEE